MGADPNIDRAINSQDAIKDFVRQPLTERVSFGQGLAALSRVSNDALVTQTIEPAGQGMAAQTPQLPQVR
jgi:hypothetical protein